MSETIPLDRAAAELATLMDRAAAGEDIVIAAPGRPAVRLVAVEETGENGTDTSNADAAETSESPATTLPNRRLGLLKGQIWVGEDFDDPLPEDIMRYFRGEGD